MTDFTIGQYMAFTNQGEVPINAFRLLGASTKRDDATKIGYFGTGLKYALAVLLREKVDFRIFSGMKEVKVTTVTTKFFDKKIQVIAINGEKTGFTIDMGIDWKPWYPVREILANCLDEGGQVGIEDVKPEAGTTKIYVEMSEKLGDVFRSWPKYFADKREASFEMPEEGRILEKLVGEREFTAYRKGIRVYRETLLAMFDYDLDDIEVNEARTAVYNWEVSERCSTILANAPREILERYMNATLQEKKECVEWTSHFWQYCESYGPDWVDAIDGRTLIPRENNGSFLGVPNTLELPSTLVDALHKKFGDAINVINEAKAWNGVESPQGRERVEASLMRLAAIGFGHDGEVDIVKFTNQEHLGCSADGRILIDEAVLDVSNDDRVIDLVLLEEIMHHDTNLEDCSRSFQNHLLELVYDLSVAVTEVNANGGV